MPVVINELEMVVEPAPPPSAPTTSPSPPTTVTPADIDDIHRHLEARRARVRAD